MNRVDWEFFKGNSPLVSVALHAGNYMPQDFKKYFALPSIDQLQEEDTHTDNWASSISPTKILVHRSRFSLDLNRPREKALYRSPADSWGLKIWKKELPESLIKLALDDYDTFYIEAKSFFSNLEKKFKKFIIYDLHSFNYLRKNKTIIFPNLEENKVPDFNIGTKKIDRKYWDPVVDAFINQLKKYNSANTNFDIKENSIFYGGYFPQWIQKNFQNSACVISIEVKKTFLDHKTNKLNTNLNKLIIDSLKSTASPVLKELKKIKDETK